MDNGGLFEFMREVISHPQPVDLRDCLELSRKIRDYPYGLDGEREADIRYLADLLSMEIEK